PSKTSSLLLGADSPNKFKISLISVKGKPDGFLIYENLVNFSIDNTANSEKFIAVYVVPSILTSIFPVLNKAPNNTTTTSGSKSNDFDSRRSSTPRTALILNNSSLFNTLPFPFNSNVSTIQRA